MKTAEWKPVIPDNVLTEDTPLTAWRFKKTEFILAQHDTEWDLWQCKVGSAAEPRLDGEFPTLFEPVERLGSSTTVDNEPPKRWAKRLIKGGM